MSSTVKIKQVVVDGIVRARGEYTVWPNSTFVIKFRDGEVAFRVEHIEEDEAHCRVLGEYPTKWKIAAA